MMEEERGRGASAAAWRACVRAAGRSAMAMVLMACVLHGGTAAAQEVIPDFYKEPGINPNRSYVNQNFNEHIDPFTGSLQLHYVDLHLPGNGGFDLQVIRSYNSASVDSLNPARHEGIAGVGWNVHFGRLLKKDTAICSTLGATVANNPVIETPDGARQLLAVTGQTSPLMLTTQRWRADCLGAGAGMSVYAPDGTRYDMDHLVNISVGTATQYAWYTSRITDRNGNTATITYAASASPQVSSVSTSDGRTVSFNYLDSGLASRRINSISSAGQTYSYSYTAIPNVTGKYHLTQVTRPGGTSWRYAYHGDLAGNAGAYLMSQLTYPEGGTVSYAYDFVYFDGQANPNSRSTVVKTKTAGGGNWNFTYAPGSPGNYDTTTVSTPSGTITYRHVGPNYSTSGTVWMVGLLVSRQLGSVQTESHTWTKQKISSQNNFRPGAFVLKVDAGEVNAPVLASRTIARNGGTHTTTFDGFDAYGNPGTVIETGPGGSRSRSITYNVNTAKWIVKQVKDETISGGVAITRTIDTNGNVLSVTRDGVTTTHTYDGQGNVLSTTFPRSLTHTYSNHKRGIAQNESQPEGVSIARVVSDAGNVTSETNGEMRTTTYGHDGLNRVTSITPPQGSPTSIAYTATSKTATRGSLVEATSFDGFGRPSSVSLGGIARSYQHDALGRMTFASNPGSTSGTSYQHDMLDRVTRITHADNTFRTIAYGAGSRTETNERTRSTTYTYRSYGDPDEQYLMSVTAAETSANISIGRNGKNLVTSVMQGGFTRTMGYNTAGYLTSVTNPETGTTSYGRDPAGNMTSRQVGSSGTANFGYDGQNRLTSATYPGTAQAVTHTYSRTHKIRSVVSAGVSRSYGYDLNDNLTSESLVVDSLTFTTTYGYNGLDQLSSITYPRSGRVVNYAPNALGRPTQVSGFATSVSYWPSGQVQQINYANGTLSRYEQNSRLWPSGFRTSSASATWINSSYGYDGAGNLTSVSDASDSGYNRSYGYDGIDRVTSASGPWGSGSMSYNGAGNLTGQSFGSFGVGYGYDSLNRLSSVSGARSGSIGYDAHGNVTSAPGATYTYDGAPNLTCVNCADPARKIAYTYDGLNRRVTTTKGTAKTYEVYGFNGNLLLEYSPTLGALQVEHIYLGGRRIAQVRTGTGLATSSTAMSAAPNPATVGQPIILTATVIGNGPTGNVTFRDGTSVLGTAALAGTTASLTATFTSAGARSLTASYGGDAGNSASTSSAVSLTVNGPVATTTTLTATPNPAGVGQSVTLRATVTGSSPTGSVTFRDGTTVLGTVALSGGVATFATSFASGGTRSLTAAYGGNAGNAASTSAAVSLAVNAQATTTTTLTATPSPAGVGQTVTLRATVSGASPTGSVSFRDGSIALGTATISGGVATLGVSFAGTGSRSLTAVYAGDAGNLASTSAPVTLVVNATATTTTALTAAPNPAVTGQSVTLTARVTGNGPTGTVTFRDGSTVLGTGTLSSGAATLATSFAATGTKSITASYAGDTLNAPSTSVIVSLTVNSQAVTSTALSAAPNPAAVGSAVTLTATVTGGTPTGTVNFLQGSTSLGSATLSSGRATLSTSFAAAGTLSLTAAYAGNTTHRASTSSAVNLSVVTPQATSTTLICPATSVVGVAFNCTLEVSTATYAPALSGRTVQLLEGSTVLGSGTLSYYAAPSVFRATLSPGSLAAGAHSLQARFNGDAALLSSSSAVQLHTVQDRVATTTDLVCPATSNAGVWVDCTINVSTTTYMPSLSGQTVQMVEGSTVLATGTLAYDQAPSVFRASVRATGLASGSHPLQARYGGGISTQPSTSAVVGHTVLPPLATTTTLSCPTTSTTGTWVDCVVQVSTATYLPQLSGQAVQVVVGSTVYGSGTLAYYAAPSVFRASVRLTGLPIGVQNLQGRYQATAVAAASMSPVLAHTVQDRMATTTALNCPATSNAGVWVDCTISVSTATYMPSLSGQSVRLVEGGAVLATGTLAYYQAPSVFRASVRGTGLASGSHPLQGGYAGDASLQPSTSAPFSHTVLPPLATTTTLSCPATSAAGGWVDCVVQVSTATYLPQLSGQTVQVLVGGTVAGSGTLAYASAPSVFRASVRLTGLPVGIHNLQGRYPGTSVATESLSTTLAHTVN